MFIWHIGDTHGYHEMLEVKPGIDTVVFSGDCSNFMDRLKNEHEVKTFLSWFSSLDIANKIMISGNHDSSFENKIVTKEQCSDFGIHYLEDELLTIDDITFYGSPWTPKYGEWSFMKSRSKINRVWEKVPDQPIDVLITHGPPKGIMDISENWKRDVEFCGDSALKKAVINKIKPKVHCFGHIHNYKDHINAGIQKLSAYDTWFSNGSVVTDAKFGKITSNGNYFTIEN